MLARRRAQVWRHQPAFRRPRHFHEEPEINLVVEGSCLLGVGDRALRLAAGQLLLFAPGQDHVLLDSSDDLELFVMALTPELAERACGRKCLLSMREFSLQPDELAPVASMLGALGGVRDAVSLETALAELFKKAGANPAGTHVLTRRALECVHAEPHLSSAALSRRLGSGASAVSRRFHEDLGVTFVEYRSRLRLIEFVRLVDRGKSFSRAALAADFGSYAQCHRVFRRLLGCAPSDYFAGARDRVAGATF